MKRVFSRKILVAPAMFVALTSAPSFAQVDRAVAARRPETVAQALVDAINAHDLDAVLRTYAPDSVARRLPGGEEFLRGQSDIRTKFVSLLAKNPEIRIEIVGRIVHGDFVVDREKVSGLAGGAGASYGAVIYEIKDGLIRNEWYLPKTSAPE
jgi:hypothetical protein